MQRRHFITNGILSVPALTGKLPVMKKGMRVLFVTDMHLSPGIERSVRAADYLRQYINKASIDFVINGGDIVYDVAKLTAPAGGEMWKMASDFFASLNKPVYHCIGNHDVYEWETRETMIDPQRCKETVVKELHMPGRYYAFEKGGWKFIVLDSIAYRPKGYRGELDEEQAQWLQKELSRNPQQLTCIISHIPIITACDALYLPWSRHDVYPVIAERLCHYDAGRIFEMTEAAHVPLFLHGHLHMREHIQYKHASIHTNRAFCADMWKGDFHGFKGGCTLLTFSDDGKVTLEQIDIPAATWF